MEIERLRIIRWPDPRLEKVSRPVTEFDESLGRLAQRMIHLMREAGGVGLAAPQVGINLRLFVMNPTGEEVDSKIYVNPEFTETSGVEEAEEGCLSLPGINIPVLRSAQATLRAQDLAGTWFTQSADGYVARIWQHEYDHLDGILLTNRMSALGKLTWRRRLRELKAEFEAGQKVTSRR
jgi:peptide deformylase